MSKRNCRPCNEEFTRDDAFRLSKKVGIDIDTVGLDDVLYGLNEEREHGDITCCDPVLTAKIVKSHLEERPDYYTRLKRAMSVDLEDLP